ncbi:quinoprotein dehydrogenase-associated SoxYZ-like carrier [Azospirillum sp. RWY-5-1]|uniref:Quinoprotein dehydrogenase-associated SoxYZ-like carrier n=1 Tax=Azospirillum oleiclasticum TaxID=2735135 RepID=A0ABX2T9N7_9PROT|nr:quinoprotein dehydrogenase-associated SoxYZ-like carrier [Azospirillum oleiclasticum]NYZ12753.1 quinoprotein dehydrogenase-associated SoxYZ-like carrier [Azospirillum oleiclasticum]NYZ19913.1 quinoprotein dehydrogenase-associated SoxYZ-like carrier [Azospirillum oleiclasticum]
MPTPRPAPPASAIAALLVIAGPALADVPADPLGSVMWEVLAPAVFGDAPVVFDERVTVLAPADVENALAMPLAVDATALPDVREMVLVADLNPFPVVLRFEPLAARAFIATRIKVEQATAVRGAARTADGVWHVNGRLVDAAGGGCAAPPRAYAAGDWTRHLGEVQARAWPAADGSARLKLRVRHPMDTGLSAGIPAYFIDRLTVAGEDGRPLARIHPLEPVSEDPVFTLVALPAPGTRALALTGRDNNGIEFAATIPMTEAAP